MVIPDSSIVYRKKLVLSSLSGDADKERQNIKRK